MRTLCWSLCNRLISVNLRKYEETVTLFRTFSGEKQVSKRSPKKIHWLFPDKIREFPNLYQISSTVQIPLRHQSIIFILLWERFPDFWSDFTKFPDFSRNKNFHDFSSIPRFSRSVEILEELKGYYFHVNGSIGIVQKTGPEEAQYFHVRPPIGFI